MDYPSVKIPPDLKSIQEWFAGIIIRPLVEKDHINPIAPNGVVISKDAAKYIAPSPTLRPHQRIEIYNQQYWWRLLDVLQTNFPLVLRLFGYHGFNESIAIPYLTKYPPDHWSLSSFGASLPTWVHEDYAASDKLLVYRAAKLDWYFTSSFLSAQNPALDFDTLSKKDPEALLTTPFKFQPHIYLVDYEYDLPAFRDEMIKEKAEHWEEHPFPDLAKEKHYYFLLFRNHKNNIAWKEIEEDEYLLMQQFAKGSSIQGACDWIEGLEESKQEVIATNLQKWLQDWTRFGWLVLA